MNTGAPSDAPFTFYDFIEGIMDIVESDVLTDLHELSYLNDQEHNKDIDKYVAGRLLQLRKIAQRFKQAREMLLSELLEPDDWVCQNCHGGLVLGYGNEVEDCDECNATGVYKLQQLRMDENDPWSSEQCASGPYDGRRDDEAS